MAISISEYLDLDPERFDETSAFDAILDVDSRLFIDPHLLKFTEAPELEKSYESVSARFQEILKLLETSKRKHDAFWREARKRFNFPEVQGLCIGYASQSTAGSGMGESLQDQVLSTAKEIIEAGIKDPEIFELMGLLEKGIGADRISDMVARIILSDLLAYSQRIFKELEVPTQEVEYRQIKYHLPRNPFNAYPIILIPRDVLRDLPMANDWGDIERVIQFNEELRYRVNAIIRREWKNKRPTKQAFRNLLLDDPELLQVLVEAYKKDPPARYNFESDPSGQIIWYPVSRRYVSQHPLDIFLSEHATPDEVIATILIICQKFKDLVENNGLHTLLYNDKDKPKYEEAAQKLFYGIADAYCEANNLDLSREPNAGRGAVDFKFSRGYHSRVLVETKLTTNPHLLHGYEVQIAEYQKAEKTQFSVYLVIDVGGSRERIADLRDLHKERENSGRRMPTLFVVNAHPKLSASKYKSGRRKSAKTTIKQL